MFSRVGRAGAHVSALNLVDSVSLFCFCLVGGVFIFTLEQFLSVLYNIINYGDIAAQQASKTFSFSYDSNSVPVESQLPIFLPSRPLESTILLSVSCY